MTKSKRSKYRLYDYRGGKPVFECEDESNKLYPIAIIDWIHSTTSHSFHEALTNQGYWIHEEPIP